MDRTLRYKLVLTVGVLLLFGVVGVVPILVSVSGFHAPGWLMDKRLKLGLDLKGGVHLVVRVRTDTALQLETEATVARLSEDLTARGIAISGCAALDPTHFRVDGVPPAQDAGFRQVAAEVGTQFERQGGVGGTYLFVMRPNIEARLRAETVTQARDTIERRVNELGVTEPSIAQQGVDGDQLLVQLPGLDIDRAKAIIHASGVLELTLVEQGPTARPEELLVNDQVPSKMEVLPGTDGRPDHEGTAYWLVRKAAVVTGKDLRTARPTLDENNQPAVSFTLNTDGGRRFASFTSENIGRQLAIVLDGRIHSVARIDGRIATEGRLTGGFGQGDVQNLVLLLKAGALPAPLDYLEQRTIGPTLGADSIRRGVTASAVGLLLVMSFMLVYYQLSGLNAVVALVLNLVILLGLMAYLGAVMTLPGIAGFVLTMGIGVDSNVLVFERIKEELEAQHGVRASVNAGFARVFLTLLDTHIAALISAAFLFQFGTGPIRGFAVTLFVGLLSNLFTSTFVSKTLFEVVLARRQRKTLSI
jgi:preprotein translocase subunit SecD